MAAIKITILRIIICCLCCIPELFSQIQGSVKDSEGHVLSFAAVHIKGTTKGSSCNSEGIYELSLEPGNYTLVFQYLGYQTLEKQVQYQGIPMVLDIVLKPSVYSLNEIVVSSNLEDPANEIIRKAIAKRSFYLNSKPNFQCDAYTKGYIKILDAPKKILGRDVGTMDGNLDSNRKGFVYLSETVSKLSFVKPDQYYEEMISSIISGRDNGFSFNSASSIRFDLYENTNEFGKSIVSPISDFAFSYYRYRLIGIDMDVEDKKPVYQIQLIPLNNSLACWSGVVYIREEDWNIQSADVFIKGKQVQQELFDTIFLRQLFIPMDSSSQSKIQQQVFSFTANFLGIRLEGKFVVVFSDYTLGENIKIESKHTLVKVLEGANEKSRIYWDSIRPVPLTEDEKIDYVLKDSIKLIRDSKPYKDSVDRLNNRFKFQNIFFGYSYKNSFEGRSLSIGSPLELIHFNPVQGLSLGTKINFSKLFSRTNPSHYIAAVAKMDYGFSDYRFRPQFKLKYGFDNLSKSFIAVGAGIGLVEFNAMGSSKFISEIYNLYLKESHIKFYEKQNIFLEAGTQLNKDLNITSNLEYSYRSEVVNHSSFSFRKKSEDYQDNAVADDLMTELRIGKSKKIQWTTKFIWSPATKIWATPKEITSLGTNYPVFNLKYGLGMYLNSNTFYHRLDLKISKEINLYHLGQASIHLKGNALMYNQLPDVPERIYQQGNPFSVLFIPSENDYFLALSPYAYSSSQESFSVFIEYNMKGLLLDRIPILNKLGFKEIIRFSSVSIPASSPYVELSIGLGNIGYKVFRLFRLDWVKPMYQGEFKSSYLRVGILSSFNVGGS